MERTIPAIAIISILGILILAIYNQGLWWDEAVYLALGKSMLSGQYSLDPAYPLESFRPPAFPLLLSAFSGSVLAARLLSVSISVAAALSVYALAKEVFDRKIALWSLLLFTTSFLFIFFSTKILTEPLFAVFLCLSLVFFGRHSKSLHNNDLILFTLFASLAFLTRYFGFILILSYLIFLLYHRKKYGISRAVYFLAITAITLSPWMALSYAYYQDPIGGFVTNIRVFSLFTSQDVFAANFTSLFGILGAIGMFIPALSILGIVFSRRKNLTHPQKLLFLVFILFSAYFLLLPYKEARYLLSFLPIMAALAGFGLIRSVELMKQYRTVIFSAVIVLSLISMGIGFHSAWENRLASEPVVRASLELKGLEGPVITQMYPYVNYFSRLKTITFCNNYLENPMFGECQAELVRDAYDPSKIPGLMEKYNARYVLFYKFEPANPPAVLEYLESSGEFRKIKSFEEFGTEAVIIYEYVG